MQYMYAHRLKSFRKAVIDQAAIALAELKAISGYQAIFDGRNSSSVLNASSLPAATNDSVARWNSLDNTGVYFEESTSRPIRTATGVIPNAAGQKMVGTGFGNNHNRTIIIIYRVPESSTTVAVMRLGDGPGGNNICGYTAVIASSNQSQFVASGTTQTQTQNGKGIRNIIAGRLTPSEQASSSGHIISLLKSAYAGGLSAGFNLFNRGATGALDTAYAEIFGLIYYNAALSDSNLTTAIEKAAIYFSPAPFENLDFYDIWGQSNAAGRASTSGVTAFNSINGTRARMTFSRTQDSAFVFGTNQNLGGDGTTSQFGAECEILRLATASKYAAISKYASGGTSLNTDWNPTTPGALYTAAMSRSLDSFRMMKSLGYNVTRKGLLWVQGEKDAELGNVNYSSQLQTLIANYRAAYGANLKVAIVKIKITNSGYPYLADIQAAQADVVANTANTILIDTTSNTDFPLFDGIHFGPTAQINIGAAAHAYFNS